MYAELMKRERLVRVMVGRVCRLRSQNFIVGARIESLNLWNVRLEVELPDR